jgi:5-(aminomethyl)-3-furanmethanol phosphate kinase
MNTYRKDDPLIIKVGGSLFDIPNLGSYIHEYLVTQHAERNVLLIAGGGNYANVVRALDCIHQIGEEHAHWIAIKSLSVSAMFLSYICKQLPIIYDFNTISHYQYAVLDPYTCIVQDISNSQSLPHNWSVTSDSIALRVAEMKKFSQVILLKSVTVANSSDWIELCHHGIVDDYSHVIKLRSNICTEIINFREWIATYLKSRSLINH